MMIVLANILAALGWTALGCACGVMITALLIAAAQADDGGEE